MGIPDDLRILKNSPKNFGGSNFSLLNATAIGTVVAGPLAANAPVGPDGVVVAVPTAQPDIPRGVDVAYGAAWNGGAVTIVGTDINGNEMQETIASSPGSTIPGRRAFANIEEIRYPGGGLDVINVVTNNSYGFGGGGDVSVVFAASAAVFSPAPDVRSINQNFFVNPAGEFAIYSDGAGNSIELVPGPTYRVTYF